jgi:vacuolar-type H+-ATPase subunit D/Vma8
MSIKKQEIFGYIKSLSEKHQALEAERDFLMNRAQARLAQINADRQELSQEVQEQLARWNVIRVADGQEPLTIQQLRALLQPERGPRRPGNRQP